MQITKWAYSEKRGPRAEPYSIPTLAGQEEDEEGRDGAMRKEDGPEDVGQRVISEWGFWPAPVESTEKW